SRLARPSPSYSCHRLTMNQGRSTGGGSVVVVAMKGRSPVRRAFRRVGRVFETHRAADWLPVGLQDSTHRTRLLAPRASLHLLLADALLAVALVRRQLERPVLGARRVAPVMSAAAVADDHVPDPQVEQSVEHGRADQNGPGPPLLVQEV